jgi:hypothetical protein
MNIKAFREALARIGSQAIKSWANQPRDAKGRFSKRTA